MYWFLSFFPSFLRFKLLFDMFWKVDGRLNTLKKEVSTQDAKHRKTLTEVC